MVAIRKRKNPYIFDESVRKKMNKIPVQFGVKKIPTANKAFSKAWNQIIKELRKKKALDIIDLDRILGANGFSYTESQLHDLMKTLRSSGILKFNKSSNPEAYGGKEYKLNK